MKIKLYHLFLLCLPLRTISQNLLANGSFEDVNTCTEYQAQCAPAAWFTTCPPEFNWPIAKEGDRTLSFIYDNVYAPMTKRSFPYTRTLCSLRKGKEYDLSFWLYTGGYSFSHLDIRLTPADPTRTPAVIGKTAPTIVFTKNDIAEKDGYGWMRLSHKLTMTEEMNFLTLGNMQLPEKWPRSLEKKLEKSYGNIVYWIDDISLTATDTAVKMCPSNAYMRAVLYDEHHRHTKHLYLDSFVTNSVPRRTLPDSPANTTVSPPLFVAPPTDTLLIPGILFATNSSVINPAYSKMLDSLVTQIRNKRPLRMQINGHTDNVASDEFNRQLSLHRAQRIKNYIIGKLPSLEPFTEIYGYGKDQPVVPNDTPAHKAKNRRVEIILIY